MATTAQPRNSSFFKPVNIDYHQQPADENHQDITSDMPNADEISDENIHVENPKPPETISRHSTRNRRPPSYLQNYVPK